MGTARTQHLFTRFVTITSGAGRVELHMAADYENACTFCVNNVAYIICEYGEHGKIWNYVLQILFILDLY
jgi:hypothetical protein